MCLVLPFRERLLGEASHWQDGQSLQSPALPSVCPRQSGQLRARLAEHYNHKTGNSLGRPKDCKQELGRLCLVRSVISVNVPIGEQTLFGHGCEAHLRKQD